MRVSEFVLMNTRTKPKEPANTEKYGIYGLFFAVLRFFFSCCHLKIDVFLFQFMPFMRTECVPTLCYSPSTIAAVSVLFAINRVFAASSATFPFHSFSISVSSASTIAEKPSNAASPHFFSISAMRVRCVRGSV